MATTQTRWNAAIKEIRSNGVKLRQNVQQCCRGCIEYKDIGLEEDSATPYAYTYGGQGCAVKWIEGEPFYRDPANKMIRTHRTHLLERVRASEAYWNHGNGSGAVIKEAFEAQGFEVAWGGSEDYAIVVTLSS